MLTERLKPVLDLSRPLVRARGGYEDRIREVFVGSQRLETSLRLEMLDGYEITNNVSDEDEHELQTQLTELLSILKNWVFRSCRPVTQVE